MDTQNQCIKKGECLLAPTNPQPPHKELYGNYTKG
jgi:hypothetical protein